MIIFVFDAGIALISWGADGTEEKNEQGVRLTKYINKRIN